MSRDEIEALREGWEFEAKLAGGRDGRGQVPDSFWETYSAFANTDGGTVLLGARERDDGSLEIAGIADIERVETDLWNALNNPQKASTNVLGRDDVRRETIEGSNVLVVSVPRAPRKARPVYINGDVWTGTYLRGRDGDRAVRDRERIRRMIAEATYDSRDDQVLERYGVADLDPTTVQAYRNYFRSTKPNHPWAEVPDAEFLEKLGATRHDRERNVAGLTVAGLLMFGRAEAIQDVFPHYFVDYQERMVETGAIEWTDRVYPDGRWSGNVYDFYRKVVLKLTADLKVPFRLGPDLYRRDETHVHEAIREALVNALIHADYEGRISILVTKESGRFTFRNPGTPRLALELIRQGGHSDCRNRRLQKMFLILGIGEQAGSGFPKILRAWREEQWRYPGLAEDVDLDTTTLTLTMANLLPAEVLEALEQRFGPELDGLPADARMALALAQEHGSVTHERLREVCCAHSRDLTLMLQTLLRRGFIEREGRGRGSSYRLTDRPAAGGTAGQMPLPTTGPDTSRGASSATSSATSSVTSSATTSVTSSAEKPATAMAILAACRGRYRTVREIGAAIRRNPVTVRRYLAGLIAAGLLERRYPDRPRDPRQAYRAATPARPGEKPR